MTHSNPALTFVFISTIFAFTQLAIADDPEVYKAKAVKLTGMEDQETAIAKKRYNVAVNEKDTLHLLYVSGAGQGARSPLEALLDACRRVLMAEIDLASNSRERIAVRKKAVEVEKICEAIATEKYKYGVIPEHEFRNAQFNRITSELLLVRARNAIAKDNKETSQLDHAGIEDRAKNNCESH